MVLEAFSLTLLLEVSLFAIMTLTTSTVYAQPSSNAKPLHFYFHYIDVPVSVAGTQTHYIMNTTRLFQAYNNSVHKTIGQPKIMVDFYLYPNLAGPVAINGTWQVFLWVNGSALKPCTWNIQFFEVNSGGAKVWDSGMLSPTVIGGPTGLPGYLDVPVYCYNLSSPLDHTFSPGNTIVVEATINPGATVECRVWYDSASYPSKAILPCRNYARPSAVRTYNANYTETNLFSVFWNESQRKVVVRANVTDPFGGYDIYMVNVTILNPANETVIDNVNMTRVSDGLWTVHYLHIYEANWSYPETAMSGDYMIKVSVVDNNGYYHYADYSTFEPFIEYGFHIFSIGVQYPVQVRTIDWHDQAMANANVRAVSDDIVLRSGYTNSSGWLETMLWAGRYNITIYWYGVEVAREPVEITNASSLTIKCKVYYPSFKVVDDVDNALPEAEVYIKSPNGTLGVPPFYTSTNGAVDLEQAPAGSYTFTILWKGITVQDTIIAVDSDGPYTVKTRVYQLTVKVLGNNEVPVEGAYVIVYTQSGVGYGLELSDADGEATFRLPEGTYKIDVRFSSVYWLSVVTANATKPSYTVNSSETLTITLAEIPPAMWTTLGFWLLMAVLIIIILIVIYMVFKIRKRTSSP